jgi:hypothetical protein
MPHRSSVKTLRITDSHHGYVDPSTHRHLGGSFTTYTITIEYHTHHQDGQSNQETVKGVVRRRYSEFEQLREHLVRHYPQCVIPPIPEKHTFSTTVFY